MIDIKKFLVEILKDKIDKDIKMSTGRQNEEIPKSIFLKNRSSNDSNRFYSQNYFRQNLSLIINWSEDYTETRKQAMNIYNVLNELNNELYDENTLIVKCEMENDFPLDINSKQIYAQQIDFKLHYAIK